MNVPPTCGFRWTGLPHTPKAGGPTTQEHGCDLAVAHAGPHICSPQWLPIVSP